MTKCFVVTWLKRGFSLPTSLGRRLLSLYCVSRHPRQFEEVPRAKALHNAVPALCFFFFVAVIDTPHGCSESWPCLLGRCASPYTSMWDQWVGEGGADVTCAAGAADSLLPIVKSIILSYFDSVDCLFTLLNPQHGKWQQCTLGKVRVVQITFSWSSVDRN